MSNRQPIADGDISSFRVDANGRPILGRPVPVRAGEAGRRSNSFLTIILATVAGLGLLGGIVAVALGNRGSVPVSSAVVAVAPDPDTGINPVVGLPFDGDGALTEAVAAPVIIDIYSDFSCPFCANFEASYAEQLLQLAGDPDVSVRWHPVSVLDHSGDGTGFSTQAGAIFLEIAATHPEHLWAVNDFFLHNQQELSAMPGQELIDTINSADFFSLPPLETIMATRGPLLDQFTSTFHQLGATGVPHILINGQQWSPGNLPWPNESLLDAAANTN